MRRISGRFISGILFPACRVSSNGRTVDPGQGICPDSAEELGKDSLLIICSHSGKTRECLEAARTGLDAGAAVVTLTHAPGSACDTTEWISIVYDWAPGVKEAEKPQGIVLNLLNELMKVQEPGYELYDKITEGFIKLCHHWQKQ